MKKKTKKKQKYALPWIFQHAESQSGVICLFRDFQQLVTVRKILEELSGLKDPRKRILLDLFIFFFLKVFDCQTRRDNAAIFDFLSTAIEKNAFRMLIQISFVVILP